MARPRVARRSSKSDERESQCISRSLRGASFAPDHHGYPRASRLTSGKTSKGHYGTQSRGCAGQTVRPSLHSISQTSVGKLSISMCSVSVFSSILMSEGLGEAIPLVDLSTPLSRIGGDPRPIAVTARENRPGDARKLIGERDCQHVAVKPLHASRPRSSRLGAGHGRAIPLADKETPLASTNQASCARAR